MATVFLLHHSYQDDEDCEQAFLLGVYSTRARAEQRVESARLLPGFRRYPDGFSIDEYAVDKDEWTEGFVTVLPSGDTVSDPDPDLRSD